MHIDTTRAIKAVALGLLAGPAALAQRVDTVARPGAAPALAPAAPAPWPPYVPPSAPGSAPVGVPAPAAASPCPAPQPPAPGGIAPAPVLPPLGSGCPDFGPFAQGCTFTLGSTDYLLTDTRELGPEQTEISMTVADDAGNVSQACTFVLGADQELITETCGSDAEAVTYRAGVTQIP